MHWMIGVAWAAGVTLGEPSCEATPMMYGSRPGAPTPVALRELPVIGGPAALRQVGEGWEALIDLDRDGALDPDPVVLTLNDGLWTAPLRWSRGEVAAGLPSEIAGIAADPPSSLGVLLPKCVREGIAPNGVAVRTEVRWRSGELVTRLGVDHDRDGVIDGGDRLAWTGDGAVYGADGGLWRVKLAADGAKLSLQPTRAAPTAGPDQAPPLLDVVDDAGTAHRLADYAGSWLLVYFTDFQGCLFCADVAAEVEAAVAGRALRVLSVTAVSGGARGPGAQVSGPEAAAMARAWGIKGVDLALYDPSGRRVALGSAEFVLPLIAGRVPASAE
jgi:hypothetical protein